MQVFCEVCHKSATIINTGHVQFEFNILNLDSANSEVSDNALLPPGWLCVSPRVGVVSPGETVELKVAYFPGITGEFHRNFTVEVKQDITNFQCVFIPYLQVGFTASTKIEVHGHAVFAQIYLSVPRPNIEDSEYFDEFLPYTAIAGLTPGYLTSLNCVKNLTHYEKFKQYVEDIPKPVRRRLEHEGWTVFSYNVSVLLI